MSRDRTPAPRDADESSLAEDHFWRVAADLLARRGVTRSTMMGFPCLRVDGAFFASFDRASGDLIVKLSTDRVEALIERGQGHAFAPAGRRFREWVTIPASAERRWPALLDEALAFAAARA